ncbi:MAG: hypothetical protein PVI89_14500 [Desulfobacteraceae bacterium]|jgi:hypothetical protein
MRRFNIIILKYVISLAVVLLFFSLAVSAAPLTTGESLPGLNLPDQHGDSHTLSDGNMVLFAPDKGAGELAHEVLNHTDKVEMAAKGIVFISDISGMPTLVARMFALPAMRKYPYLVLLGYEKEDTARFPRQEGRVTVLHIQAGKVSRVEYADSPEGLAGIIGIQIIPKTDS